MPVSSLPNARGRTWATEAYERRPDQKDSVNTYSKHSLILHAGKWFKMGPMKPKTSPTHEQSWLFEMRRGRTFTSHSHKKQRPFWPLNNFGCCDKRCSGMAFLSSRACTWGRAQDKHLVWVCFPACLVTSFQLKWRPLHDLQPRGEMKTGKYTVSWVLTYTTAFTASPCYTDSGQRL